MVKVKRYRTTKAYQREAARMQGQGWRVASTTSEQQRSSCMRIILLGGIGALIWKPKSIMVVTYERK